MKRLLFVLLLAATNAHAADLGKLIMTIAGGDLALPRLSPDGRRLAYARGGEVRIAIVATRHTDVVIPAKYGVPHDLEWTDDANIEAEFPRRTISADVVHKRRVALAHIHAVKPMTIDFCDTRLRASAERDTLTLWRESGPSVLPLATIYPADSPSIDIRRTTPGEVIFIARIAPRSRPETTNHLIAYDGVRLHAYGIDFLDDASFSADGRRVAISVWTGALRRLLVFQR